MLNFSTLFYYFFLQALIIKIKIKGMLEMKWTFHLLNISDGEKKDFGDIQML